MCSATQELRGLGLANLMGAAFNCYTTTGSFSRSAIMNDVGAKTQLAGIVSGELPRHLEVCVLQAEGSQGLCIHADNLCTLSHGLEIGVQRPASSSALSRESCHLQRR